MKPKSNKMWILISVVIVFNIIIFKFMSKKLESYVASTMVDSSTMGGI